MANRKGILYAMGLTMRQILSAFRIQSIGLAVVLGLIVAQSAQAVPLTSDELLFDFDFSSLSPNLPFTNIQKTIRFGESDPVNVGTDFYLQRVYGEVGGQNLIQTRNDTQFAVDFAPDIFREGGTILGPSFTANPIFDPMLDGQFSLGFQLLSGSVDFESIEACGLRSGQVGPCITQPFPSEGEDVVPVSTVVERPFGAAASSITVDGRFNNGLHRQEGFVNVPDEIPPSRGLTDDPFLANLGENEVRVRSFITNSGQGAGRGEVNFDGTLSAGAIGQAAGTSGTSQGRGLAFRTYVNEGSDPVELRVDALLDGEFSGPRFGLPLGDLQAKAGIHVFEGEEFDQFIDSLSEISQDGDIPIEDILFGEPQDLETPLSQQTAFSNQGKPIDQIFATPLITQVLIDTGFTGPQLFEADLSTDLFTIDPGETFSVLFDVLAFAAVNRQGGQSGGGSVNFFNTLGAGPNIFTDANGEFVTTIRAAGAPSPIPEPDTLALFGLVLGALRLVRRQRNGT